MFVVGSAIGIFAGFRDGIIDVVLMRHDRFQMSIPVIILAITILGMSPRRPRSSSWCSSSRAGPSMPGSRAASRWRSGRRNMCGRQDHRRLGSAHHGPPCRPEHPAAHRLRRGARHRPHDDLRGDLRLHRHRHPAAHPDLRHHHFLGTQYLLNAWWITIVPDVLLTLRSAASISWAGCWSGPATASCREPNDEG